MRGKYSGSALWLTVKFPSPSFTHTLAVDVLRLPVAYALPCESSSGTSRGMRVSFTTRERSRPARRRSLSSRSASYSIHMGACLMVRSSSGHAYGFASREESLCGPRLVRMAAAASIDGGAAVAPGREEAAPASAGEDDDASVDSTRNGAAERMPAKPTGAMREADEDDEDAAAPTKTDEGAEARSMARTSAAIVHRRLVHCGGNGQDTVCVQNVGATPCKAGDCVHAERSGTAADAVGRPSEVLFPFTLECEPRPLPSPPDRDFPVTSSRRGASRGRGRAPRWPSPLQRRRGASPPLRFSSSPPPQRLT
jgi:hypothetical protein